MTTKKAVVFDLDGTILDTIGDLTAALNRALAKKGYPSRTVEEVISFIGNGSLMLIRRASPVGTSDEELLDIRELFRNEYQSDLYSNTKPYDGICELLQWLSEKGIKVIVITNKDDASAVLMIEHYFGESVDYCRGVRRDNERKPSPVLTLSALESFGITPDEALFVGDGIADAEVSNVCNIDFIPLGYGYGSPTKLQALCGKTPLPDVSALKSELMRYFN